MDDLKNYPVIHKQQVAWGDMDAFGHVNNVIYYRYMESARIEYFNQLKILDLDINTVVASNQCKYIKPVFFPDILWVGAKVVEIRNSAMRMEYLLYSEHQNMVVATGEAVIVLVDSVEMKKTHIPKQTRVDIIKMEESAHNNLSD